MRTRSHFFSSIRMGRERSGRWISQPPIAPAMSEGSVTSSRPSSRMGAPVKAMIVSSRARRVNVALVTAKPAFLPMMADTFSTGQPPPVLNSDQ